MVRCPEGGFVLPARCRQETRRSRHGRRRLLTGTAWFPARDGPRQGLVPGGSSAERILGRSSHGSVTEVHRLGLVIERFLDGSAFFMAGLLP